MVRFAGGGAAARAERSGGIALRIGVSVHRCGNHRNPEKDPPHRLRGAGEAVSAADGPSHPGVTSR